MNNLVIRIAKTDDIPQLLDLMKQYIVDFYKSPQPNQKSLEVLISQMIENPSIGLQFVAEIEGSLVGFATLYFSYSTLKVKKVTVLNDLFVLPDARGQKIGEKLFQTCLSYIRKSGFANMSWVTAKDNFIAQSLYEKMGGKRSEWLQYEKS